MTSIYHPILMSVLRQASARRERTPSQSIGQVLDAGVNSRTGLSSIQVGLGRPSGSAFCFALSVTGTVQRLHEFMLLKGLEHEVNSGRVGLPRYVTVTLNEEQSLDQIAIEGMKQRIHDGLQKRHENELILESIVAVSSKNSALVQLADVVAGSANRRLNFTGTRNHKDDIADLVIERLGIELDSGERDADLDATVMFRI
ncbi:DUF3800 domain-containing protein [Paraburkholderia sp. SIMBA_030]